MDIQLYPHQQVMVSGVRAALKTGKHATLQSPTGSGKSIIAADMIKGTQLKGRRAIFVVPRKMLIDQMSKNFNDFGIAHSFLAAGRPFDPNATTYIASLGSIMKRLPKLAHKPDIVFFDEAHFGGAQLAKLADYFEALGCYMVELSATPKPKARPSTLVQGPTIKWLINNGFLSQYRLFAANFPDLSKVKIVGGEYNQTQLAEVMEANNAIIGDAVDMYKKHAMGRRNICFTISQKEAEKVCQRFNEAGVPSAVIDSTTPDDERVRIIRAYAAREILNLVTARIAIFGFDLEALSGIDGITVESMSDMAATNSLYDQLQKWGRVLRRKPEPAYIFDHVGNSMKSPSEAKHGMPCWDREWDIEAKDKKSRDDKERLRSVRVCDGCFAAYPAHRLTCPDCGRPAKINSREVEEMAGDLHEIDPALIAQEKKQKRMEVGQARTLADLRAIAAERGYKSGWVFRNAKLKGIMR